MISQTRSPRLRKQGPSSEWQRGRTHYVLPTLVVLPSATQGKLESLRRDVEKRLRPFSEIGALRWIEWPDSAQESPGTAVARGCEPLLTADLWRQLINRGYQPFLPGEHMPRVQVIVVWDGITGGAGASAPELSHAVEEARQQLGGRAELLPVLVWLGKPPEDPGEYLQVYWPRVRLDTFPEMGADLAGLYRLCQHLLVALVATEITRAINHIIGGRRKDVRWLVLGASVIMAEYSEMQDWLHEATLEEVLGSVVACPLTDVGRSRIEKAVEKMAKRFQETLFKEVRRALEENGWQIEADSENLSIRRCRLIDERLGEIIFGQKEVSVKASPRYIPRMVSILAGPLVPRSDLEQKLFDHYRKILGDLHQWYSPQGWQGLSPAICKEWLRDREEGKEYTARMKVSLGAFLHPGIASQGTLSPPWEFGEVPPTGLEAVIHAVAHTKYCLSGRGDIWEAGKGRWVRPGLLELEDEKILRAVVRDDADKIRGYIWQYHHFSRTLASPLGVTLNLLPAWLLATYFISRLLNWEMGWSLLVSGAGLFVIGLMELAYQWLVKARRLLDNVLKGIHRTLIDRVLALAAQTVRDHRLWILHRLREVELSLQDLHLVLLGRYRKAERVWWHIKEARSYVEDRIYHLVDKGTVLDRASEAAEDVLLAQDPECDDNLVESHVVQEAATPQNKEEEEKKKRLMRNNLVVRYIARKVWPLACFPAPAQVILEKVEKICAQEAEEKLRPGELEPSVIAEKEDELKGGKRWSWLWWQAQPLGKAFQGDSFTIMLVPETGLLPEGSGKKNPYWQEEWLDACTLQSYEVMCIRGIIETKAE